MAFKKQSSQAASNGGGLPASMLNDPAYQDLVNQALSPMRTQQDKIAWLYKQGWAAKQACDLILVTREGTRTPEQHFNTVVKKLGLRR
jgi:hypothetical protein